MIRLVEPGLSPAIVWLITYLGHSTLWVGGAWLLGRRLALPARARSWMWRMAILGPLLTCALQLAAGASWTVGSVRLAEPAKSEPLAIEIGDIPVVVDVPSFSPSPSPQREVPSGLLLAALGGAVAISRLVFLARASLRLRRGMGPRRLVTDRRLRRLFARLRAELERPVPARLTESAQLASPVALGAGEVCLPTRAQALDDAALAAVLGHELAHLERRDNLWLLLGAVVEAVFFFQPLNRLARRALQESAELASDERAVELTDDPVGMARSLAEVAGWGFGPDAVLASPVVSERGALLRRVRSLLERDGRRQPLWLGPLLVGGLAAFALALPSFGDGEAQASPVVVAQPALPPAPPPPARVNIATAPSKKPPRGPRPPRRVALVDPSRVVPPPARTAPPPPAPPAPVAPLAPPVADVPPVPAVRKRAPWPAMPPRPPMPPVVAVAPVDPFGAPVPRLWKREHGTAFVLVKNGNAIAASANADEQREALALKSQLEGEYLWVRRHDRKVAITDGAAIASLRPMLEQQRSLRDREAELSVAMAELGKRQAELGKRQAEMGTKHAELGMKSAELGVRRAELDVQRMDIKVKARQASRAAAARDGKSDPAATERAAAELARMEEQLRAKQEELGRQQRELGQRHGDLGRQQSDLGRQQGDLGRQQGELGRKMGEMARDRALLGDRFGGELDRLVEQQMGAGKARVLEPGKGR